MTREIEFDQVVADYICEHIADGRSLRSICGDTGMPAKSTVFKWLGAVKAFSDQYARAREAQADSYADDIADIADDKALEPNDRKVRIDARKWLAGKLRPKVYGDRQQHEHAGPNGGAIPFANMTREERQARIKDLQERRERGADGSGGD